MPVDKPLLNKLAHLARLEMDEAETTAMLNDLNSIVAWVEKLKEVDTAGVEPLTSMTFEINALREDEVKEHLERTKALENAPATDGEFFKVPKVLE